MTAPLLELRNVHAKYGGISALRGISLCVQRGEIVTVIGSNGAGKSTILKVISALHRCAHGSVLYCGDDITQKKSHQIVERGISHVPEGRKIFPRLTVEENLDIGAYLRTEDTRADKDRIFTLFPILRERCRQLGGTLSGGEQQMLAIARALMGKPTLLLLDEPSMGVAPKFVEIIFEVIQRLQRDGITVLLIEQNAQRALQISQRGYVLETGAITLTDESQRLVSDPRVKTAYLGG